MSAAPPAQPDLVIFHEVSPADLRKMAATSNDSPTGGGARDIRFSFKAFDPVFTRLLPHQRKQKLRRKGIFRDEPVRFGKAQYPTADGRDIESTIEWYTPTDSRPNDGRVPRVNGISAMPTPRLDAGVPFLLIIRSTDGEITFSYAYRDRLAGWDSALANAIVESLSSKRGKALAAGWINLQNPKERYIHGQRP